MIATSFIPIMKEMNGLNVRPCCIDVLEQVLNILKKHVSNDEREVELQTTFKCDIPSPPPALPTKPVPPQLHYTSQNKNNSGGSNINKSSSNTHIGSQNSVTVRSQPLENNTITLDLSYDNHPHQNVTYTTPSIPPTVRNRIPAASTSTTQRTSPQSMVVVSSPPATSSQQNLKVTHPPPSSSGSSSSYQQGRSSQTFSDGSIMQLLREESQPKNKFLFNNQMSSTSRKVLTMPKNLESNKKKEVELAPGSGVKIPESELTRIEFNASSATDPAVLVIGLLQYFFSDEVLARSTATSCRGKGRAKHSTAKPLNQRIMQAIRHFSTTFAQDINRSLSETQVNRITANKIGTAKMALKRRQEDHVLSLHSPSQNKVKRHSTSTSSLNTEEFLNFPEEQLNYVIKVEKEDFH